MVSAKLERWFRPAPFDDCEDPNAAPGAYKGPDAQPRPGRCAGPART